MEGYFRIVSISNRISRQLKAVKSGGVINTRYKRFTKKKKKNEIQND